MVLNEYLLKYSSFLKIKVKVYANDWLHTNQDYLIHIAQKEGKKLNLKQF